MDLRSFLRLLADQWKFIFAILILSTTTCAFLTAKTTPEYASQVTLFISARGQSDNPLAAAYEGNLLSQQKVKSYQALLTGHDVMAGTIDRLRLKLTKRQLLEKVTTAAIPETSLLTATVTDPSPDMARMIANAIGEEFVGLVPMLEGAMTAQSSPVRVTIVGPAERPDQPVSPRPVRNYAAAVVLGLIGGIMLAAARRSLDTTVKSAEVLTELASVPSLGMVPADPAAAAHPVITAGDYGLRGEAFRKIRTNLHFLDVDKPHRVLLVTSPLPNDGKSVTACNLAVSLAETGKRVLIVDADLRRPSVAGYLGMPSGAGVTSVLLGSTGLRGAIQALPGHSVSLLASGPLPPNPSEILGSRHMRELVQDLRDLFDIVIVDSPPVLPVADAAALAALCDGVVLVVRHGKDRHDQVREAVASLRIAEARMLGAVLNMTPRPRRNSYTYHSYEAAVAPKQSVAAR